jgi:hypothetical protein
MRYDNRLKRISNRIGKKARGRVKQMRRENKKAQRLRDQATFEGSKAGLVASMMNETKYTTVENHVIRDADGATITGEQPFLNRLMDHCKQVNSTTDTHPMEPNESEEDRKEWMYCKEIKQTWAERQQYRERNVELSTRPTTEAEWKDYIRRQKCVSCPEDGFQGAFLRAFKKGETVTGQKSMVLMMWRAAVDIQLKEQYVPRVLEAKKRFDVTMAEKAGKDPLDAKSYRSTHHLLHSDVPSGDGYLPHQTDETTDQKQSMDNRPNRRGKRSLHDGHEYDSRKPECAGSHHRDAHHQDLHRQKVRVQQHQPQGHTGCCVLLRMGPM